MEVKDSVEPILLTLAVAGVAQIRVGDTVVNPEGMLGGWTDFHQRIPVHELDLSPWLSPGRHLITISVGDGWACGQLGDRERERYFARPMVRAALTQGEHVLTQTDSHWEFAYGSVLQADLIQGTSIDLRPDRAPSDWQPAIIAELETGQLVAALIPPPSIFESLVPREPLKPVFQWDRILFRMDFGQNLVGQVSFKIHAKAQTTIKIRYAEMLQTDGSLYTENLRAAAATDFVTVPAGETKVHPAFTFHGFRYAEISCDDKQAEVTDVQAHAIATPMTRTGWLETDHPGLNRLIENIRWGQLGNFLEIPTDCPQRDERLGWTGDAQIFVQTSTFHYDVEPFFTKWFDDLQDAQMQDGSIPPVVPNNGIMGQDAGPGWADAVIICPWRIYQSYGNKELLANHYPMMERWYRRLIEQSRDGLYPHPQAEGWKGFGDWLALDNDSQTMGRTPHELVGTAYAVYSGTLLGKIAETLGESQAAQAWRGQAEKFREGFRQAFIEKNRLREETQTAYVLAIANDIVTGDQACAFANRLVELIHETGHLTTGFLGTPPLCPTLDQFGHRDVAYNLLFREEYPSWLYMVAQGATTMWERWNSFSHENGFGNPGMNSFNHYAYGSIGAYIVKRIGGIDPEPILPGFAEFRYTPRPPKQLNKSSLEWTTRAGEIVSQWHREGDQIYGHLTVPSGAVAHIDLPDQEPATVSGGKHEFRWQG